MRFEKVSFDEFKQYFTFEETAKMAYDRIILPRRGTSGSAGYDFYLPLNYCFTNESEVIPTGVRVILDQGYFLMCVPRSGLGFKYGVRLKNSTGIIDEDYAFGKTEGHILAKLRSDVPVSLHAGDRFMQGILVRYGIVDDDAPLNESRTGGFGSTGGASL